MGTGLDTASAADAEIMVYRYFIAGSIVAVFYRTRGDTRMTVDAFFFIHFNNRR
jgi:hypothetical protein